MKGTSWSLEWQADCCLSLCPSTIHSPPQPSNNFQSLSIFCLYSWASLSWLSATMLCTWMSLCPGKAGLFQGESVWVGLRSLQHPSPFCLCFCRAWWAQTEAVKLIMFPPLCLQREKKKWDIFFKALEKSADEKFYRRAEKWNNAFFGNRDVKLLESNLKW